MTGLSHAIRSRSCVEAAVYVREARASEESVDAFLWGNPPMEIGRLARRNSQAVWHWSFAQDSWLQATIHLLRACLMEEP